MHDLYDKGNSEFEHGEKIVLLKNEHGIDAKEFTHDVKVTATTGLSLAYNDVAVRSHQAQVR